MLLSGVEAPIRKINGRDDTKRFLESLGFVVGGNVSVVSEMGGNLIVNVKNTRIAINKNMANRIIV
jgi:ferrous iron transport protein A